MPRVIFAAYVVIAAYHLMFTVLQPMGCGAIVWGDMRGPWGHCLVHGAEGGLSAAALPSIALPLHRLVFGSFEVAVMAARISSGDLAAHVRSTGFRQDEMLTIDQPSKGSHSVFLLNGPHQSSLAFAPASLGSPR